MTLVMGMDQHRAQISAEWIDTITGEISRARVAPADRAGVRKFLARFKGEGLEVALEATTGWRFLAEELQRIEAEVHLAEVVQTSGLKGRGKRPKTDWADARHLRELLLIGRLPESWIAPAHLPDLRARVRCRHTLVEQRTEWQRRMHAVLYHHGCPQTRKLLTLANRDWIARLTLPAAAREQLTIALEMIDAIEIQLGPMDLALRAYARKQTVDQRTHTAYVGTLAATEAFDASTCSAAVQSGCGTIATLALGEPAGGPNGLQVDPANDTLYTANFDTTVSAFDLHDCNAGNLAGCATDAPGTVTVPAPGIDHALWLTVDAPLDSVYVVYQKDDALKVIDTNVCSGGHPGGCATLIPPEVHTGADPESVILDPQTQTLYTANWVDNDVSVIDATRCNADTTGGCRHRAPEVPIPAAAVAADPAVHTTYVGTSPTAVAMINTSDCNAFHAAGCSATPPTLTV